MSDPNHSLNFEQTSSDLRANSPDVKAGGDESGLPFFDIETRYETVAVIGRGGMGEVVLATDRVLGRKVAIKRLRPELVGHAKAAQRFQSEAKAVAALNHYHIVQIHDFGRSREGYFLVMEFVEGESLADRIRRDGPLNVPTLIELGQQLCDALGVAHGEGIIHRDIKPANILLGKRGMPKITDFGLARHDIGDTGQTQAGVVLGTLEFMSPEQMRDAHAVDARSDLWSLGATLYQAATGASLRMMRPDRIPEALRDVILKALEDDPAQRYQTAEEFSQALARCDGAREPQADRKEPGRDSAAAAGTSAVEEAPGARVVSTPSVHATAPALLIAPFDQATALRAQQEWARYLGKNSHIEKNSLGIEMVLIPPGEYLRGSDDSDPAAARDEKPRHRVRITQPFWLGKTVVTQAQWKGLMGKGPWEMYSLDIQTGDKYPAMRVSWDNAREFVKDLNAKEATDKYRLPTEAEWEHACRAGTTTPWSWGDAPALAGDHACHAENFRRDKEKPSRLVEQRKPNPFGLFDMHGNVQEWCADWYEEQEYLQYLSKIAIDPSGPEAEKKFHVFRGGAWKNHPNHLRSAVRGRSNAAYSSSETGFRLARAVDLGNLSGGSLLPAEALLSTEVASKDRSRNSPVTTRCADKPETWRLLRTLKEHSDHVTCVDFSPDGQTLLTGSSDGTAILLDVETGERIRTFTGHSSNLWSACFSSDGRRILTTSHDKTAILWDIETGKPVRTFTGHKDAVNSAAISCDGTRLLTVSRDKTVLLWNAETGEILRTFNEKLEKGFSSVAFSPNGEQILLGTSTEYAMLIGIKTGFPVHEFKPDRFEKWFGINAVRFSADGTRILLSTRHTCSLWDAVSCARLGTIEAISPTGHKEELKSAVLSCDGSAVLTCSRDKKAMLWDAQSGKKLREFTGHTKAVMEVAISPNSTRILTGSIDKTAMLWGRDP